MPKNISLKKVQDLSVLLIWQEKNLQQLQSYKEKVATGMFKPQAQDSNPMLKHLEGMEVHGLTHEHFDTKTEYTEYVDIYIETEDLLEMLDGQIIKYHHKVLKTRESLENLIDN